MVLCLHGELLSIVPQKAEVLCLVTPGTLPDQRQQQQWFRFADPHLQPEYYLSGICT